MIREPYPTKKAPTTNSEAPAKPRKPEKPRERVDLPPPLPMLPLTGNTPIPAPSEPLQFRAIGLVKGKYQPSDDEFTKGAILTDDGTLVDTVLLGRIMSLVKNSLELDESHVWVAYPRLRKDANKLHLQVVGVWEPRLLLKSLNKEEPEEIAKEKKSAKAKPVEPEVPNVVPEELAIPDNYFSVRGEVIFQSRETKEVFVKIKQAPKNSTDQAGSKKYFKLRLLGEFPHKMVGYFWEFDVLREGDDLTIRTGRSIASLRVPKKGKKPPIGGGKPSGKRLPDVNPSRLPDGNSSRPPRPSVESRREVRPPVVEKPAAVSRPLPRKIEMPDK
jgi:hypothetical protein